MLSESTVKRLIEQAGATWRLDTQAAHYCAIQRLVSAIELEARREALEEAATVAEQTVCDTHLPTGVRIYGTRAAAAIRALPDAPKETMTDDEKQTRIYRSAKEELDRLQPPEPPRPVDTNSRCTQDLRAAGKAYPRTCAECGLGPCRRYQKETHHD